MALRELTLGPHVPAVHPQAVARLQIALVVAIVATLYSNVLVYAAMMTGTGLRPVYALGMFVVPSLAVSLMGFSAYPRAAVASISLVALLIGLNLFGYLVARGAAGEILLDRLLGMVVLGAVLLAVVRDRSVLRAARMAMAVFAALGALANVYEAANPFVFVPLTSEFANPGRSAGFYVNANQSAIALSFAWCLSLGVLSKSIRPYFTALVMVGVLLTFSRAGVLGFVAVLGIAFFFTKELSIRQGFVSVLAVVVAVMVAWFFVLPKVASDLHITPDFLYSRVGGLAAGQVSTDFSQVQRTEAAEKAVALFELSPLYGSGVGSTETWAFDVSTHNQYLQVMADFGLLGILVLGAYVKLGLVPVSGRTTGAKVAYSFVALFLFFCLFSHNLLREYYSIVSLAVAMAIKVQADADVMGDPQ